MLRYPNNFDFDHYFFLIIFTQLGCVDTDGQDGAFSTLMILFFLLMAIFFFATKL